MKLKISELLTKQKTKRERYMQAKDGKEGREIAEEQTKLDQRKRGLPRRAYIAAIDATAFVTLIANSHS